MLKKLGLLAIGFTITHIASANELTNPASLPTVHAITPDLYLGLQLGMGAASITRNLKYIAFEPQHETENYQLDGISGGAYFGAGVPFSIAYIGIEAFTAMYATQQKTTHGAASFTQTQKYACGVDLIPGIWLQKHSLFYLRAGLADSKFIFKNTRTVEFRTNNLEKNDLGLDLGVGISTNITKHISIRVEYLVTAFKQFQDVFTDKSTIPNVAYHNKFSIINHQFNVGCLLHLL